MKQRIETALRVINHLMLLGLIVFTLFACVMTCKAQDTTTVAKTHNLVITKPVVTPDTILAGYTVELNGVKYQIYKTARGAYYYWRKSKKTNKLYKCYLTAQQKQQLELL